jgi:hypothetical protein
VRLSALVRPDSAETLKLAYKCHIFFIANRWRRAKGAMLLSIFLLFWGVWSFELQFFCKFVNFNEVFQFLYDLFYHERLKSSTKVEDEVSSLINIHVLPFYVYTVIFN